MLSLLIFKQIISMFLMVLTGYVLVKKNVLKEDAGMYLAKVVMYVVLPCSIINAFQIDQSGDTMTGLVFAFVVAIFCNFGLVISSYGFKKIFELNTVEQASITYPNSGDILIPLVTSVLSPQMTVYCCAFMVVQLLFMFTHGMKLLANENEKGIIDILKNPNVIAICIGLVVLLLHITIPEMIAKTMNSFAEMIAPLSMLVIGISIAKCKLKENILNFRIYLIIFIRQFIYPLLFLLIIKIFSVGSLVSGGDDILLILYMAMASCPAATIVNIAQTYNKNAEYASVINVVGVVLLIITLPVMVSIFQFVIL